MNRTVNKRHFKSNKLDFDWEPQLQFTALCHWNDREKEKTNRKKRTKSKDRKVINYLNYNSWMHRNVVTPKMVFYWTSLEVTEFISHFNAYKNTFFIFYFFTFRFSTQLLLVESHFKHMVFQVLEHEQFFYAKHNSFHWPYFDWTAKRRAKSLFT